MSTIADVRAVLKPFVERHPDLLLIGRAVILRPFRHLMCGYYLDRTSAPELVKLLWFANMMYVPWPSRGFLWSGEPFPRQSNILAEDFVDRLYIHMDAVFAELRNFSDATSGYDIRLPSFRDLTSFSEIQGLRCVADGELDQAEEHLSRYLEGGKRELEWRLDFMKKHTRVGSKPWQRAMEGYDLVTETLNRTTRLLDLVRTRQTAAAANLLRDWERQNAQLWKVEKHWIPSPFPFELS